MARCNADIEKELMSLPNIQDVCDYTEQQGIQVEVALTEGMKKKAEEFREQGAEIYKEV